MTIQDIYAQYAIPQNLQQHMLRVSGVCYLITNAFQGKIHKDRLLHTMLLHDMGNILKFKFDNPSMYAQDEQEKLPHYQQVQQQFRQKYGTDPDQATLTIMAELGLSLDLIDLCQRSHGDNIDAFLHTDDWEAKISFYSDMRVGPHGVLSVNDRFADLIYRYPQDENLKVIHQKCLVIESQLQNKVSLNLATISDASLAPLLHDFLSIIP